MSLRAMPNLWVVRPGDANETAVAWKVALEREDGPVALALSRQKLPTLDRSEVAPAAGARAGRLHALGERRARADPDRHRLRGLARARRGQEARRENGTAVRVVSMPCWELFEAQPQAYRDEVLPPDGQGAALGRGRRLVRLGALGRATTATRVARRPLRRLGSRARRSFEHLGFTVDNVVARADGAPAHDKDEEGNHDEQAATAVRRSGRASGSTTSRATCSTRASSRALMEDDAVVGVTSNPTIFQKAIGRATPTTQQLKELAAQGRRPEGALPRARPRGTWPTRATCCARSATRPAAWTATSPGRSTRPSPTTATAPTRRRSGSTPGSTGRTCT